MHQSWLPPLKAPFEGLIYRKSEVFPVAGNASDEHHSLVLLIGGLARGTALERPSSKQACDGRHIALLGSVLSYHPHRRPRRCHDYVPPLT